MITIVPYQRTWPDEFQEISHVLQEALGDLALQIDHIGSTSVPGLAAKDIIDIQVTVESLAPEVELALNRIGYGRLRHLTDHIPVGSSTSASEWEKWVFKPPAGQRLINLHVRIAGRANQRYALLFRDYLRTHPTSAQNYGLIKMALAQYHADDKEAYYVIKDPVCDMIIAAAEEWVIKHPNDAKQPD